MPDVLITENIRGAAMDALHEQFACTFAPDLWQQPDELLAIIGEYRALIARNQTQITRELIAAGTRLEVIGRAGVGMDNVDLDAANEYGIVVALTPEQNTNSVAELVIGLLIALARKLSLADRDTKAGRWDRPRFHGTEISGKTLGIVGFGRIGSTTALKARALGMTTIAYDPYLEADCLRALQSCTRLTSLEEVLTTADYVTLHIPENEETRGMFGAAEFAQMKPSAYFINSSRGGVVQEAALAEALQQHRISGAALEVRQQEPAAPSTFDAMDNVIQLPHIGAQTREAQHRVVTAICRDVAAILRGGEAQNFANFSKPKNRC
ncbi:MAG: hydroxyacid dehydrogenase [Acidobacteria bacterium]|nr:hydroxyacid dehydrogenase [Acidobacteriota bacterium]